MTSESFARSGRLALNQVWVWAALLAGLVVTAGPFFWMVSTSLKLPSHQFEGSFLPDPITFDNYLRLFTSAPYLLAEVYNSLEVSVLSTVGQVLTCAMAGFAFSVFQFRGRNVLFAILLLTLTIPPQVTLIPNFIIFSHLGLIGTKVPLWIGSFLGGAFGTFLLRQYFASIPFELAEAARTDGASLMRIFVRVYFPLSKPALSALAILTFTGSWNELIRPLVYLPSNQKLTTLTVGLSLYQAQYSGQWSFLMACAVISILPILLVFLFAQRQIIEGSALTGIK
jgi:multiple sugar transport system permease protein